MLPILAVTLATVVSAQSPRTPEFDVASVKLAGPPSHLSLGEALALVSKRPPPGQWAFHGITLQNAIVLAYPGFHLPGLLVGGPKWIDEARFELQARMSPAASQLDVQAMFRHLLEERF